MSIRTFRCLRPWALLLVLPALPCVATPSLPEPALLWQATGFSAPESVVYDADRDLFYVSNMGTHGEGAAPGDGFISRLDGEGRILDLQWVQGLENPKGLALANGRLYVGDDDALVEIDLEHGAIVARRWPRDGGPGQFNDCTADAAGNVYVYSRRLATIYRLSPEGFTPWVEVDVENSGHFNGLRADGERLLAGSWEVPTTGKAGHLSTFDLADGHAGRIGDAPIGHIDGIEPDGRGGWTVTDFSPGRLLHVAADGTVTELLVLMPGTADHLYLPERQLLLVPLLRNNRLLAFRWAPGEEASDEEASDETAPDEPVPEEAVPGEAAPDDGAP